MIMLMRTPLCAGMLALLVSFGAPATAQEEDTVIATVGGEPVYRSELAIAETDLGPQFGRLPEGQRRAAALSVLIDMKVLARQAEKAGLGDGPLFERRLTFLKDRELHNDYVTDRVMDAITEAALRERYEREVAAIPSQQEIRARHILVDSEEQAKTVIEELDAGRDFVELAQERSTGPSAPQGGDLGYFTRGRMVPEFEEAAFAIEPGAYTPEPVKSQFGWHIIKVEDRRDQPPLPFEQVADQLRRLLIDEQHRSLIDEARETVDVEVTDADLQALLDNAEGASQN